MYIVIVYILQRECVRADVLYKHHSSPKSLYLNMIITVMTDFRLAMT